ncbi:hypothetical protein BCR43DRAFT_481801 [Syncephalastrum racemosum]|uniref:Ubinuclein middle domain-containing protein n=1 Tax=Syncephalastrum racemosum TaxID=13706 RepID=A0A1X2HSY8_SYNRA|nr:hypothetical protein BCR43DRAFT_481801 [Syncephalastrum racemosum]
MIIRNHTLKRRKRSFQHLFCMSSSNSAVRISVPIKDQALPVVFSYRDLYKKEQRRKPVQVGLTEEDEYFRNLVERAAKYNPNDEDDEDESDGNSSTAETGKRGGGGGPEAEYDYDDPFIDDSDLLLDANDISATLPEYEGFFVFHGLLDGTDETGSKRREKAKAAAPKKTKQSTTTSTKSSKATTTQKEKTRRTDVVPSPSTSSNSVKEKVETSAAKKTTDPDEPQDKKITSTSTIKSTAKTQEPAIEDIPPHILAKRELHAEVAPLFEELRELASKESFEVKSKFPVALRPVTLEIGQRMFRKLQAVDDDIMTTLIEILPYNRFTMTKFITTKSGAEYIKELNAEIEELRKQLKASIDEVMPEQIRSHNDKLPTMTPAEAETKPRFKFNDHNRRLLYDLLRKFEITLHFSNEISRLSGKPNDEMLSENKERRNMYSKLVPLWPEHWMTNHDMSRQYSMMKQKLGPVTKPIASNATARPSKPSGTSTARTTAATSSKSRTTPSKPFQSPTPAKANPTPAVDSPNSGKRKLEVQPSEPPVPDPKRQAIVIDDDDEPTTNTAGISPANGTSVNPSASPSISSTPHHVLAPNAPLGRSPSMTIDSLVSEPPSDFTMQ